MALSTFTLLYKCHRHLRESFPRQVDKKSRGPQGERGLEFSRRKKEQTFFSSLLSLGLYNNNVFCLRTVSGLNFLANSVILKCKLWEWSRWSHSVVSDSFRPHGHQVPPSMGFSRQEYWSGLPFPSPGNFPTQGSNPGFSHCRQTLSVWATTWS